MNKYLPKEGQLVFILKPNVLNKNSYKKKFYSGALALSLLKNPPL